MASLENVKDFWEKNPLWTGESNFEPYTFEFYNEHRNTYIDDCFGGKFDKGFYPKSTKMTKIKKYLI